MTREQLNKIWETEESQLTGEDDNAFLGLQIIRKYFPNTTIISGADHDILYSVSIDGILKAGLTEGDAIKLCKLNWGIEEIDCLSCFV